MKRLLRDVVREAVIKAELPQYEVKKVLVAVQDAILRFMEDGDNVVFGELGIFQVKIQAPRRARNPRTGEKLLVPARRRPRFRFYPEAKARIQANRRGLDGKEKV